MRAALRYGVNVWYLSKSISDLPFDMLTTVILASIVYWAIGFTSSGANFAYFLFMLVLVALLSTGFGHFMGTIASVAGKPEMAVPFTTIILFPMFLFAGPTTTHILTPRTSILSSLPIHRRPIGKLQ